MLCPSYDVSRLSAESGCPRERLRAEQQTGIDKGAESAASFVKAGVSPTAQGS
jgi:hypothetical protein